MNLKRSAALAALLCLFALPHHLVAQCGGNGANADMDLSSLALGVTSTLAVHGAPGETYGVYLATAPSVVPVPGVGIVCLDLTTVLPLPVFSGAIPASGTAAFPIPIPNDPALLPAAWFLQGVVSDPLFPGGLGLTQAHRADFEIADNFAPMPNLAGARALGAGVRLDDGRVLIAGGGAGSLLAPAGTSSCELFDPYTRSVTPAAPMSILRAAHTATLLPDGRVLVCGGVIDGTGNVGASCELYDPVTNSWSATASMSTPRAGHTATALTDGRVLVCGGTTTFAGTTVGAVLNAAVNSGEVYDPATGLWTSVSNTMASKRLVGAATRLQDGRVLVVGGLSGASSFFGVEIPNLTATANFYNPATNSFVSAPSLSQGMAGSAITTLPTGGVWLSGGVTAGLLSAPTATTSTAILNGSSWSNGPSLPVGVALHGQVLLANGDVHVLGGVTGDLLNPGATDVCVRFNGSTLTPMTSLPVARGAAVNVGLESGAIFVGGGADGAQTPLSSTLLYTADI